MEENANKRNLLILHVSTEQKDQEAQVYKLRSKYVSACFQFKSWNCRQEYFVIKEDNDESDDLIHNNYHESSAFRHHKWFLFDLQVVFANRTLSFAFIIKREILIWQIVRILSKLWVAKTD